MLVLVATTEPQEHRSPRDGAAVDGELVLLAPTDDDPHGFPTLLGGRRAAAAIVVERPGISRAELRALTGSASDAVLDEIEQTCIAYGAGTVLTRRGPVIVARRRRAA